MVNRLRTYALCAGAVALMSSPAWGLINATFTPIHLTGEAQLILRLRPVDKPEGGKVQLKVVESLKGVRVTKGRNRVTISS